LPLFSTRHVVSFPAADHHFHVASTTAYCMETEAVVCEQLAQSCYMLMKWSGVKPAFSQSIV